MAVAIAQRIDVEQAGPHQLLDHIHVPAYDDMSEPLPSLTALPSEQSATAPTDLSLPANTAPVLPGPSLSTKKRKASKAKLSADLKRSQSTPHIRGLAMPVNPPISPTLDKKRNKLGYHRTSVACGHCRRRKIRCVLPTPEDPQGRCSNCIRLKKDCQFYAVTEASQHETRPAGSSRKNAHNGAPSGSNPASPHSAHPSSHGAADGYGEQDGLGSTQSDSFPLRLTNGAQYPHQTYPYPPFHSADQWSSSGYSSAQVSSSQPNGVGPPSYWSATHPVVSTSFKNSPTVAGSQVQSATYETSPYSFGHGQEGQLWSQPRSLSLSHVEGNHHPYGYHPLSSQQSPHLQSPAFSPYPHHLPANHASASEAASETSTTTASHPSYPAYSSAWTGYPPSSTLHSTHEPPATAYPPTQWYEEQSPLTKSNDQPSTTESYPRSSTYYPHASHA